MRHLVEVELGGIEPPSINHLQHSLRLFLWIGLTLAAAIGCLTESSFRIVNLSFQIVSGLSSCRSSLLLPGCDELAPCGITAHCVSRRDLILYESGCGESGRWCGVHLFAPFNESEQLESQMKLQYLCRNRSAPKCLLIQKNTLG